MNGAALTERAFREAAAAGGRLVAACRRIAFWVACLAPAAYVPLFVLPADWWAPEALGGAIAVHFLALFVAHDHRADGADGPGG